VTTRRILAVVLWGVFALGVDLWLWMGSNSSQAFEVDFIGSTGLRFFATWDHSVGLVLFAVGSTGAFIASVVALIFPNVRRFSLFDNSAAMRSWTCPHCRENNLGDFDECWNCLQKRPTSRVGSVVIGGLAAVGLLLTTWIGLVTGLHSWNYPTAWWNTARYTASITTLPQWSALIAWAGLTGVLIALSARRHRLGLRLALATFIAGAFVPVCLVLLAGQLNKIWPGSTGPLDRPFLTLILVVSSLVIPWTLGRVISRFP
jgi:hypothetical protein